MTRQLEPDQTPQPIRVPKSPGFWKETWNIFKRKKLAMLAVYYVVFLSLVAMGSPFIVGTKPIVTKYQGNVYFPAMGYFSPKWENPIFVKDGFAKQYYRLQERDPDSWAIWPLIYQDPKRRIKADEWPDNPGNPASFGEGQQPSWQNLFGTTSGGIDVFAQMVHATRTALLVGFVSMGIAGIVGITLGAFAGYFGGWIDTIISRIIELILCLPTLVLILALLAVVDKTTIWHLMVIIGLTGWTGIARLTRAEFLKLKKSDFVAAARVLGVGQFRIIFRHILPNSLAPVLVPITFGIASAILLESGLSFLGVGGDPSSPSWGKLLDEGRSNHNAWWLIFFPGMAVFSAVLSYNLIGEGLQEATDPRLRDGSESA
ncbi:MAG: ABC transporter permease [Planctomycetaceae bacterium]|nr:ABC transporter permease [Planctomycetaceae bacterium]